jgi:hypothetical protein
MQTELSYTVTVIVETEHPVDPSEKLAERIGDHLVNSFWKHAGDSAIDLMPPDVESQTRAVLVSLCMKSMWSRPSMEPGPDIGAGDVILRHLDRANIATLQSAIDAKLDALVSSAKLVANVHGEDVADAVRMLDTECSVLRKLSDQLQKGLAQRSTPEAIVVI